MLTDESIQKEAGSHRRRALRRGRRHRQDETQRANRIRRDPRKRAPFVDRLARARQVERLQIPEAAVDGPEMVERRAAAKVVPLDQRDRQAPLRRIVGDRQPVNAATDDEDVEGPCSQSIEVALHEGELAAPAILLSAWRPSTKCGPIGSGTSTISRSPGTRSVQAGFARVSL